MRIPYHADPGLDQSREVITVTAQITEVDLQFSPADRRVLHRLAGEVASLAARPAEDEKRELWRRHNALEATRPLVFCDPEHGWHEIYPPGQLECESRLARRWELRLRKEIFWGTRMGDDYTIEPHFDVPHVHAELDWGMRETRIGGQNGGAWRLLAPVKSEADLERLHFPRIRVDRQATARVMELAEEILGDLLSVRLKTRWWWSLGLTRTLVGLRGLDQMMYDMVDRPWLVHRLMSFLRDGTLALLDGLKEQGLLSLNCDATYVGSGGLGWSTELPQPDFDGAVRPRDMWGFAESQETVGVSPGMFAEFVFPYQLAILERFGLNCYGCCEPVDSRWHILEEIPRLRRVSVSPWANLPAMAEMLGDAYICSIKPNPAELAMDTLDEDRIRANLQEALSITRHCHVEIIMKDNHTIRNDPQRVIRWVRIAKEEAQRL
jgi:hypothetical protein